MTNSNKETNGRSYQIWAFVLLFFCIDSLFGPPKYFSAAAYLAMAFAFSIKGFNLFESRRWGRPAFNTLNVLAFVFLAISIGRRILA
jgi:hypothetical protein